MFGVDKDLILIVGNYYNHTKLQIMNSQNNYDFLFKYIMVGDTSNRTE